MQHPSIPCEMTTAAHESSPMLMRRYLDGGGSVGDFLTDLSHAIHAALAAPAWFGTDRRTGRADYTGPERRRQVAA